MGPGTLFNSDLVNKRLPTPFIFPWNGTRVGPAAIVVRGPSEGARCTCTGIRLAVHPFSSLYPASYFPLCFDLFRVTVSTGNSPSKRPTHHHCYHARPLVHVPNTRASTEAVRKVALYLGPSAVMIQHIINAGVIDRRSRGPQRPGDS